MNWFNVDKDGLRQTHERLIERNGFGMIGGELWQNVRDTTATYCQFDIVKIPGRPRIQIDVEDNGEGFQDLSHAWTMYAPSAKKDDPTKAGRFNIGEKMVLSFAYKAKIHTTSGTVLFDENGRTEKAKSKKEVGTLFSAELACNETRYEELIEYMLKIIVPEHIELIVNGAKIKHRKAIKSWEETMSTEIGETLSPTKRKTIVEVYPVLPGEIAHLYELGIPVVETGDKYHVNILQKVPLNKDRDNVTPAFLKAVRVTVMNNMFNQLDSQDTTETWVNEAASDERCKAEAVEKFRVEKYGEKSVAFDPKNAEANAVAVSKGYTLIPSRGLTTGQRENLKLAGTLMSSSQQFPQAGKLAYSLDPSAPSADIIPEDKWSKSMKAVVNYTEKLSELLVGHPVRVTIVDTHNNFLACYSPGRFDFNVQHLGRKWFEYNMTPNGASLELDSLIIHELGHEYESNHLSERYYNSLTKLGAKLKMLALTKPNFFKEHVNV